MKVCRRELRSHLCGYFDSHMGAEDCQAKA